MYEAMYKMGIFIHFEEKRGRISGKFILDFYIECDTMDMFVGRPEKRRPEI